MIRWIRQYRAVARNACVVCLSDPVFLVLQLTMLTILAILTCLPTFNFGEEMRLIRDQSLALLFIGGCIIGATGIASVFVRDLKQGTVAVLMSRPVSSTSFIFGKWSGVALAVAIYHVTMTVTILWMTAVVDSDVSSAHDLNYKPIVLLATAIIVGMAAMAVKHYFMGGWYVWQATLAVGVCILIFFGVNNFIEVAHIQVITYKMIDWPLWQGCLSLFFAELIFCAILVVVAMRGSVIAVLISGVVLFFGGLLSESLILMMGDSGLFVSLARALLPNWQSFWLAEVLNGPIPKVAFGFLASSFVHTLIYSAFCLTIATYIFNRQEFSSHDSF